MISDVRGTIGAKHLPLRDQVLMALRNAIINGDYSPGERLTEDRLATDFGVSRNPVREALRVAEIEGFVVVLPRRGAVVASPTDTAITDIFAVRERLEPLAARLAAERADPEGVANLRELLELAREATERGDLVKVAELNTALHLHILEMSGNPRLSSIARGLYLHVQWVFRLGAARRAPHSWREHIQLVEAIESGDPDRAEATALSHVDAASRAAHENAQGGYTSHRPHA